RGVLQALAGEQDDGGALAFGFAEEVVALFIAGQAKDGHTRNPAEPPTHSKPLLWSTPIWAPRPMRTMVLTARSSFSQMYLTRTWIVALPAGVSIRGVKLTRSCSR